MKKQIVAILAIVAVITALITVSAVSNDEGYNVSPCDAIDISIENTVVIDFLNATNMTNVQVYNFKGYKGENTWMVQWFSSNRLLDVYVNVATGDIVGIEEKTDHSIFNVHVYPEGKPIDTVSSWQCCFECCNGTEYIYEGNVDYYIEVIASSNSWKLEVEDYY